MQFWPFIIIKCPLPCWRPRMSFFFFFKISRPFYGSWKKNQLYPKRSVANAANFCHWVQIWRCVYKSIVPYFLLTIIPSSFLSPRPDQIYSLGRVEICTMHIVWWPIYNNKKNLFIMHIFVTKGKMTIANYFFIYLFRKAEEGLWGGGEIITRMIHPKRLDWF